MTYHTEWIDAIGLTNIHWESSKDIKPASSDSTETDANTFEYAGIPELDKIDLVLIDESTGQGGGGRSQGGYIHPLDHFNKEELLKAYKIMQDKYSSMDNLYLHSYWTQTPDKSEITQYLNKRANNRARGRNVDDNKVEFDRILACDISFIDNKSNNNGNSKGIRTYYNILIDISDNTVISERKLNSENFEGFPMVTAMDFEVGSKVILSDSDVMDYFVNKLGIDKKNVENGNVFCFTTGPIVEYLKLMNDIDHSHRYSFPICFDLTYTADNGYQNQIPFLGILDLDDEKLIDFFTCEDLGVECYHTDHFKLQTFLWSDARMNKYLFDNDIDYKDLKLTDLSQCQNQRFSFMNGIFEDKPNKFNLNEFVRPNIDLSFNFNDKHTNTKQPKRQFTILNNHEINWMGWSFHESFHLRFGTILSDIRFNQRSIIYELHLSDIYVPYQHNIHSLWWYSKFYVDGSQYGPGWMMSTSGNYFDAKRISYKDCPGNSYWFETYIMEQSGEISQNKLKYACLFERYTGSPRVRHAEVMLEVGNPVSAPQIELVYRYIISVGHYDYLVDKIFDMNGNIKVLIAAHGYDQVMQITENDVKNNPSIKKYCGFLDKNYCGPRHDHFFSFRIDMDVDGRKNTFYKGEFIKENVNIKREWYDSIKIRKRRGDYSKNSENKGGSGSDSVVDGSIASRVSDMSKEDNYGHIWYYEEQAVMKEEDCKLTKDPFNPKTWIFRSGLKNEFGIESGYEIYPLEQDVNFMLDRKSESKDIRDRIAEWTGNVLHVVKYNKDEYYASGKYTWQQDGHKGIKEYLSDNEDIVGQDLVAFMTVGFHHVTKLEDAPILAEKTRTFVIEPNHFFNQSRAACGDDV